MRTLDFGAFYVLHASLRRDIVVSNKRPHRAVHWSRIAISSMMIVFLIAPSSLAASADDPFISIIQNAKKSIAPVVCLNEKPAGVVNVSKIDGSAFFIDEKGTFLTASHVIKDFLPGSPGSECEAAAIYLPLDKWGTGNIRWFKFFPENCIFDGSSDVSACRTVNNIADEKDLSVKPSHFEISDDVKPDGTNVAFTGFPLNAIIPYTSRADVLAYPIAASNHRKATTVILDKEAWPGASGSPIYTVDGKVIGLITQRGQNEAVGTAIAVDGRALSAFAKGHLEK
jgi:V8-like Glu-specific endopeptidase